MNEKYLLSLFLYIAGQIIAVFSAYFYFSRLFDITKKNWPERSFNLFYSVLFFTAFIIFCIVIPTFLFGCSFKLIEASHNKRFWAGLFMLIPAGTIAYIYNKKLEKLKKTDLDEKNSGNKQSSRLS